MSDPIGHECGVALIRLRKPLEYYQQKYGTALYGFQKLFLLMEKQHNRGQDGAGIGCCKINTAHGQPYLFRERNSSKANSLSKVFRGPQKTYQELRRAQIIDEAKPETIKEHFDFGGQILLGHLRYGTSGAFEEGSCHPYIRRSNWATKSLMVAGNFNMANAGELNRLMVRRGQHPVFGTDTQTVLEEIGFHLDEAHDAIYHRLRDEGLPGEKIPLGISHELDLQRLARVSAEYWDGGYAIAGTVGNGDVFVMRDPNGIRPCFYIQNEELVAFASERVPLMTVFGVSQEEVRGLPPGHVFAIKASGEISLDRFNEEKALAPCSFERIYFSRGNDPIIYRERKRMGQKLVPQIIQSVGDDLENTVFSFIPNTAEVAYHGLMHGLREYRREQVREKLRRAILAGSLNEGNIDETLDELIMANWPRGEKIAHKDIKLRTFISQESGRNQLVSHVYDVTYGVVQAKDNLVVVDDSIVRGTTLRKSILHILARLNPKKIVIASTAPQIRYPDCYGIDMSELGKFIAFQAAVELLKSRGRNRVLEEVREACVEELRKPVSEMGNCVQRIYEPFSPEEISQQIAQLVRPTDSAWKGEIEIVYQSIENLAASIDPPCGDWYFTGHYPTPAGYAVANRAYLNYADKVGGRTYDLFSSGV
ncbi:MAG: amidophosphoribosyltransferase [Verrucomicrobiota bacterium]